jgi:hypothetical protein
VIPKLISAKAHSSIILERVSAVLIDRQNKLGGNILGEYRKKNGVLIPAACTGDPPTGWAVSGLELIVGILPVAGESEHRNNPGGVDGQVTVTGLWQVDLRQHYLIDQPDSYDEQDQHNAIIIDSAWDRMICYAPSRFEFAARGDVSSSYSQLSFLLPFSITGTTIGSGPYQ